MPASPEGSGSPAGSLAESLDREPAEAAVALLGAVVRHAGVAVRLTEVEAYAGPADPGSHAYRRTPRSEVMYGAAGVLYVYAIYGLHVCANVVVGTPGSPGAVLLRGGEVVSGVDLARERRPGARDRDLARGPARLCRALALTLADNRADLAAGTVRLTLPAEPSPTSVVSSGPRVGLRRAAEVPWRFWLTGEPTVSAYRPAAPRRAPSTP